MAWKPMRFIARSDYMLRMLLRNGRIHNHCCSIHSDMNLSLGLHQRLALKPLHAISSVEVVQANSENPTVVRSRICLKNVVAKVHGTSLHPFSPKTQLSARISSCLHVGGKRAASGVAYAEEAPPPEDGIDPTHWGPFARELHKLRMPVDNLVLGENRCVCPKCGGGSTEEEAMVLTLMRGQGDPKSVLNAVWLCHRATCGYKGAIYMAPSGKIAVTQGLPVSEANGATLPRRTRQVAAPPTAAAYGSTFKTTYNNTHNNTYRNTTPALSPKPSASGYGREPSGAATLAAAAAASGAGSGFRSGYGSPNGATPLAKVSFGSPDGATSLSKITSGSSSGAAPRPRPAPPRQVAAQEHLRNAPPFFQPPQQKPPPDPQAQLARLKSNMQPLSEELLDYFEGRGISKRTLEQCGVNMVFEAPPSQWKLPPTEQTKEEVIVFPYRRYGEIVNCKYRASNKQFRQVKGGEKVLYGLDDIKGVTNQIVIVEGEVDKLSLHEVGITASVSVPDGAPAQAKPEDQVPAPDEDVKFSYVWDCKSYLEKVKKVVLALDSDEPGQALGVELARRIGREKCYMVTWPKNKDGKQYKDANEVLMSEGPQVLRRCIADAKELPIRGLFKFADYGREIRDYYHLRLGEEGGVSTGWRNLDELYKVVPGELTVVTGVPNSGKSEWIDALLVNLNHRYSWSFALCSMENKVRDHARKLVEKHTGLPFFDALYAKAEPRMTEEQLEEATPWLNRTFCLIRCEDDELPSIDWVLDKARAAVMRYGVRGLVIDPYNELDHQRPPNMTETEYVSRMLTKVKRFAGHHDCHVWFVAHPRQMQQWKGEAPQLYDISGSAHFMNKCDNGVVVHRNRDQDLGSLDIVEILVRKVRSKTAGTIGEAMLRYDRINGRYYDVDPSEVDVLKKR